MLCLLIACLVFYATFSNCLGQSANDLVEQGASIKKLVDGLSFTEGPVWIGNRQILVFSDIPKSRLMQWSQQGGLAEFRASEQANGNILDLQGRLVSCQHAGRNVVRTEEDGSITVLVDNYQGRRFNSPNDIAVRSDGTFWFTDPAWGLSGPHEIAGHWVFRFDPKTGDVTPVIKDLAMPNGINFSPDESQLYVADTGGHSKHPDKSFHEMPARIVCYQINQAGLLGDKQFEINHGSDGMAVDVKGNLYTTDAKQIKIYNDGGTLIGQLDVPENPANCCFGDDDYRTLFITARTSLYSIRLKNAGAKPIAANW